MLKIQPNLNKNLNNFLLKNNKKILLSSLITATVLSAISSGACSKLNNSIIEDKFEKQDTTEIPKKDSILDIIIDTTYNVINHEITL